jgi:hypothetical protein
MVRSVVLGCVLMVAELALADDLEVRTDAALSRNWLERQEHLRHTCAGLARGPRSPTS